MNSKNLLVIVALAVSAIFFALTYISQITIVWFGLALSSPLLLLAFIAAAIRLQRHRLFFMILSFYTAVFAVLILRQFPEWIEMFDYKSGGLELRMYEINYFRLIYFGSVFPVFVGTVYYLLVILNLRAKNQ